MRSAENIRTTLISAIERNLNIVDLSLYGVQDAFTHLDLEVVEPELRNMALFDRAGSAEYLSSMLVLSANGDIVYDSRGWPPRVGNFADRDYFRAQKARSDGTYLSVPLQSRLHVGDPSIALSRRLSGPDGQFAGVVVGGVRLAYFASLFSRLNLGRSGVVSLVRTDGTMLIRTPSTDGAGNVGVDVSKSPTFQRMLSDPSGDFTARASLDGAARHYSYGRIGTYPLILAVGFSVDDVFSSWLMEAVTILGTGSLVCATIIALFMSLQRTMDRQTKVEDDLARLATTDSLTGLANRRHFDDALAQAWNSQEQQDAALSLLIVDVDHFKVVNDTGGHAVGDRLLRCVGDAIRTVVCRPGDVASRYGGDEFAIVLPGTDRQGALAIATRIRNGVQGIRIEDGRGGQLSATVSVGIGTVRVPCDVDVDALFRTADRALYAAKAAGRNSVAALP